MTAGPATGSGAPGGDRDAGTRPGITAAELAEAGAVLAAESARYAAMGWMRGTSGNLSTVLRRDPLRLAVTTSGRDKSLLTPDDVVAVDATGAAVPDQPDPARRPSAEAGLHARIAAVAGAGAVVHVHALAPVVAAERWPGGIVLRDLEMLKGFGRAAEGDVVTVPVVANSQDMRELGDRFAAAHDPATPALVVARHGIYAWGDGLAQVRAQIECLEWMIRFILAVDTV